MNLKQTLTHFFVIMLVLSGLNGCSNETDTIIDENKTKLVTSPEVLALQTKADKDDPDAQCWLALSYQQGLHGCKIDEPQSQELFQKVAKHANDNLAAVQYSRGIVANDFDEKERWFRKAANQGFAPAQYTLAGAYLEGIADVSKNEEEGVNWIRLAAEQEYAPAQLLLSICYSEGMGGIRRSNEDAVKWLRKSADQEFALARFILGDCYENGRLVEQDSKEAARWYDLAAKQGHAPAQEASMRLGVGQANPQSQPASQSQIDKNTPLNILQTKADQDDPDALFQLALCYTFGLQDCDMDFDKAMKLYHQAAKYADKGIASAQTSRGMCYWFGYEVEKDIEEAFIWFNKASDQQFAEAWYCKAHLSDWSGHPTESGEQFQVACLQKAVELEYAEAQFKLGLMYGMGVGVPKDMEEGLRLIHLAAKQGHPKAMETIKDIFGDVDFTEEPESAKEQISAEQQKLIRAVIMWAAHIREMPDSTGILDAVIQNDLPRIKKMIQNDPSLLKKSFGNEGLSLLHMVSVFPATIETLKYLIEQNADVRAKTKENCTPVVYACATGNHEAILYLLANGSLEPHEDCMDLPEKEKLALAFQSIPLLDDSLISREDMGDGYVRETYRRPDWGAVESLTGEVYRERADGIRRMTREIIMAKSGKDLKKYVLQKQKN